MVFVECTFSYRSRSKIVTRIENGKRERGDTDFLYLVNDRAIS